LKVEDGRFGCCAAQVFLGLLKKCKHNYLFFPTTKSVAQLQRASKNKLNWIVPENRPEVAGKLDRETLEVNG